MLTLDANQQQIVECTAKNIIVCAGAGSGKTRVLTERVKHLIDSGVQADNIVAITFTNNAADEMKQRLEDVPTIGDAFIGTIHSFANKIFKNSDVIYDILNAEKELEIMRWLIRRYAKYTTIDDYLHYLDLVQKVDYGVINESVIAESFNPSTLDEIDILLGIKSDEDYPENVNTVAKDRNYITFSQLLKETITYYESIGGSVEYLLVDEFQDIGYGEYKFLMALKAANNFFVGDDWQAIYGFKGGDVKLFLRLMQSEDWTSFLLTNNYRNCQNIVKLALTVIRQADNIIDKEIDVVKDSPGTVQINNKAVLDRVLEDIKKSQDFTNWAILCRSNKELFQISEILQSMDIPFTTFKRSETSLENIQAQLDLNQIKLLTVHTAKGLEFDSVILYGNFPVHPKRYLKNSDERKVMYVGITRAINNLILLN